MGDCLAIAALNKKKFSKRHYKLLHPHGSIGNRLKTTEDLMISKNGIPFIEETKNMKTAIDLITKKKLTTGIITDGQLRRANQHNKNILSLKVKDVMTKNPLSVNKDTLAVKSLSIMSEHKITSLCVHKNKNRKRTIGILHIHHILNANIQ